MVELSVIIPTRNRPELLKGVLASLACQAVCHDTFEVIVVDNASSNAAAEVVQGFSGCIRHLRCIKEPEPGLHNARHRGMHAAAGEILAFIDDDVEVAESWISALREAFRSPDVILVGGNNLPAFAVPPPTWLERWWNQPVYKGRALGYLSILDFGDGMFDIDPAFVWGCNFSIRKEQLIQYGGFHPDAFPADMLRYRGDGETAVSDAVRRFGARTLFHSGASIRHHVPAERMTVEYFQKRAFAQGVSNSYARIRELGHYHSSISAMMHQIRVFLLNCYSKLRLKVYPVNNELESVKHCVNMAYWDGYRYHQYEVAQNPDLLAWVLRERYL